MPPPFSDKIAEAHRLMETADPMEIANLRAYLAVADVPLRDQRVAAPSLGGQTPENMEIIAREERSTAQARDVEQVARARWVASQKEVIDALCAGQTDENKRAIRATFTAMKRG